MGVLNNSEEIQKDIREAEEKIRKDKELFKSQRKAALTWNIIFFIGILITSIIVSLFTKSDNFNFKDLFTTKDGDKISLWVSLLGLLISFIVGVSASYAKKITEKDKFDVEDFLNEVYSSKLDKSSLNPNRNYYDWNWKNH